MTTSQQPIFHSREQFLANGLVHARHPAEQTVECGICMDDTSESVTLGCHNTHIFCFECINQWLKQSDCCPMCKKQLFYTTKSAPKTVLVERAHDLLHNRGPMHQIEHFGAGPLVDSDESLRILNQSASNARWWLGRGYRGHGEVQVHNEIRSTAGDGLSVNTIRMATDFAMIGNYIPAVSEVRNRPYSAQQQEHWTLVLTTLWNLLRTYNGKTLDTSPHILYKRLKKKLKRLPDFDRIQFLRRHSQGFDDSRLCEDLKSLLNFVAYMARVELHRQRRLGQVAQQQEGKWKKKLAPVKGFLKQLGPSNWGRFRYL
ncbi:hypothetical protein PRZ48_004659 [Zasmidium cellare]|uniref:RING-type domain-containing protein n=1 Tax=Zasmidium cellare TaxID=395010 RepID=A0ABR0EQU0_ZASCE|nr:hypothetical protein PRZ48_004659 [Zasmidium cellare]